MCVAIVSPNRKHRPSRRTLELCEQTNPHGSGFAWVERGSVCYLKGRSVEQIYKDIQQVKGPVIIHFRIRSVGPIDLKLAHPFEITEEPDARIYGCAKRVIFANGTWDGWQQWQHSARLNLEGPVSDTRVAAAAVWQNGFDWLKDSGCKFAMLTHKRSWRTLGTFYDQPDGCLYSNLYWKPQQFTPGRRLSLHDEVMACFGD